jgi:hypothetical protein
MDDNIMVRGLELPIYLLILFQAKIRIAIVSKTSPVAKIMVA